MSAKSLSGHFFRWTALKNSWPNVSICFGWGLKGVDGLLDSVSVKQRWTQVRQSVLHNHNSPWEGTSNIEDTDNLDSCSTVIATNPGTSFLAIFSRYFLLFVQSNGELAPNGPSGNVCEVNACVNDTLEYWDIVHNIKKFLKWIFSPWKLHSLLSVLLSVHSQEVRVACVLSSWRPRHLPSVLPVLFLGHKRLLDRWFRHSCCST